MSEVSTLEPQATQQSPNKEGPPQPNKVKDHVPRLIGRIKNRMGGSDSDSHAVLEEVAEFIDEKQSPSDKEAHGNTEEEVLDHRQAAPPGTDNETLLIQQTSDRSDLFDREEASNAELGAPHDTEEAAGSKETQLSYTELRGLRFKQNEVEWRVNSIVFDIDALNKGIFTGKIKTYSEGKIEQELNWISENPDRASRAVEHILAQENIIDIASSLPGLTASERESIDKMYGLLGKVRNGLEDRGIAIAPHRQQSAEINFQDIPANNLQTPTENVGVPIDPETAYEYAYHATSINSMPSIAKHGLQPSPAWSKEPGTIFYTSYEYLAGYLPPVGMLYRTHVSHIPECAEDTDENGKPEVLDVVGVTESPIPQNFLEYSFNRGETWRKDMTPFVAKTGGAI